jgi:hypothetical protein
LPAITLNSPGTPVVHGVEGAFLCLSIDGGTTYTQIGNPLTIDPPERSAPEVDTTTLLSPVKTSRPGKIPDMGEISHTYQHDNTDATHIQLEAYANASATVFWALVFPIGAVGSRPCRLFQGWMSKYKFNSLEDEKNLESEFTVKIVTLITLGTA